MRERRCRFALSQRKCDHLSQEKFDCEPRARRFDLTRLWVRRLERSTEIRWSRDGAGACGPASLQHASILGEAWKSRRLKEATTPTKQRADASATGTDDDIDVRPRCSLAWPETDAVMALRAR
jgi:hypothetical protein